MMSFSKPKLATLIILLQISAVITEPTEFTVRTPEESTLGHLGGVVVLQCQLSPALNAENMNVLWKWEGKEVHKYRPGSSHQNHNSRTQLFQEELKTGNVSLHVSNLQLSDQGKYTCSVLVTDWYSESHVTLEVIAVGSAPLITVNEPQGSGLTLTCVSVKWFPQPELIWTDGKGEDLSQKAKTTAEKDTERLFAMTSHLDISSQMEGGVYFQCLLRHKQDPMTMQSRVQLSGEYISYVSASWKNGGVFLIIFVLGLLPVVTALVLRNKRASTTLKKERADKRIIEEECSHLKKESEKIKKLEEDCVELREDLKSKGYLLKSEWKAIQTNLADVTLDPDSAHPDLILSEDGKKMQRGDSTQNYPESDKRFDRWCAVVGRQGFDSGRHYWEVDLGEATVWKLGVVCDSADRKGDFPMNSKTGYWILEYKDKKFKALSVPETEISLRPVPHRVGLYLDYEEQQLSFYGVEDRRHLHTFRHKFTERLYPLFFFQNNDVTVEIVSPDRKEHDNTLKCDSQPLQGPFCDTV